MKPAPARRVVTGHDADGTARVFWDAPVANVNANPRTGQVVSTVWCTERMPADIGVGSAPEDMGARALGRMPPPGGTRFAVIDLPPHSRGEPHRTDSLDYVIVMSGEADMLSDDGALHVCAGDVIVQRGASHAWINDSDAWVRLALVKIDATPIDVAGH